MAMKGKLKDLGIADALQMVGSEKKTGVLSVESASLSLDISFLKGQAVRVFPRNRRRRDLLGTQLIRAGVLSPEQLESALELQTRSLRRLGDILVTEGHLTSTQLREMMQLQISEALFSLLDLKKGSWSFLERDVEADPALGVPISPETILEEGIRRLDEWPAIRKTIPSNHLSLIREERLALPEKAPEPEALDAAFDAVLRGESDDLGEAPRSIGDDERLVYSLVEPGISIQEVIDRSLLGAFEASKALYHLIDAGYLSVGAVARRNSQGGFLGFWQGELGRNIRRAGIQVGVGAALLASFALATKGLNAQPGSNDLELRSQVGAITYKRVMADVQMGRIEEALELYRFKNGKYPDSLDVLLKDQGLSEELIRKPFRSRYYYGLRGDGFVLLPPLD